MQSLKIVGEGMVAMDIALFMLTVAAAAVQLYCLRTWENVGWGLGLARVLRLAGWMIISARFGSVLFTQGDIAISVPSAIGLMFLACGEIVVGFNRGKFVRL